MKISIITLFPQMFSSVFDHSIIKRAMDNNILQISFVDLRQFGIGKHKLVDDTPYGGGSGMLLRADVLHKAIENTKTHEKGEKVILLTAHGRQFNQVYAKEASTLKHLIIVCGHYEGFDDRVKKYIDEEVSVGDFVLTGGEIPAMLIVDSIARLVKGVIKEESSKLESFSPYLEHPQYTKPRQYDGQDVPEVLLSGDHKKILQWKDKKSLEITKKLRPELIEKD